MKNLLFWVTISINILVPDLVIGQSYNVSVSNEPFVFLENADSAVTQTWYDPEFIIPIGFSVQFFQDVVDSLYSLDFFAGSYFGTNPDLSAMNIMLAFSTDLLDRGVELDTLLSPILYKTEGASGHEIFTLEFRNAGFTNGEIKNGIYTDFINFQLRIYEESNNIEVHIGPYSVENPGLDFEGFSGPSIGLAEDFDFINDTVHGELFLLAGDPLMPSIITSNMPLTLVWPIPENTVYTFSYLPTSLNENDLQINKPLYFPNPSSGSVSLHGDNSINITSPVYIYDSNGILVRKDNSIDKVELDGLPCGIYALCFQTSSGNIAQRISLIR